MEGPADKLLDMFTVCETPTEVPAKNVLVTFSVFGFCMEVASPLVAFTVLDISTEPCTDTGLVSLAACNVSTELFNDAATDALELCAKFTEPVAVAKLVVLTASGTILELSDTGKVALCVSPTPGIVPLPFTEESGDTTLKLWAADVNCRPVEVETKEGDSCTEEAECCDKFAVATTDELAFMLSCDGCKPKSDDVTGEFTLPVACSMLDVFATCGVAGRPVDTDRPATSLVVLSCESPAVTAGRSLEEPFIIGLLCCAFVVCVDVKGVATPLLGLFEEYTEEP